MDKIERDDLLIAREVSVYLRIPLRTIYHLSKTGKIKAVKIGKQWRYRKEDIEHYECFGTRAPIIFPDSLPQFEERRSYPRINCAIFCDLSVVIPTIKNYSTKSTIGNLSAGGVFMDGNVDLSKVSIGDPVKIRYELDGSNGENIYIEAEGRIARVVDNSCGIKFRRLKEKTRQEILNYVG